jgi:hypothetical protein
VSRARAVAAACVVAAGLVWLAAIVLREPPAPDATRPASQPGAEPPAPATDLPVLTAPRTGVPSAPRATPGAPHLAGLVVRKSDDSPLPGVRLTLTPATEVAGRPLQAISDADGEFDIAVPAPLPGATLLAEWTPVTRILDMGDETEQPLHRGSVKATLVAQLADYTSGAVQRLTLDTGWLLGGQVNDGTGRPLQGATLLAETGNAAISDAKGGFLIRDIDPVAGHVLLTGTAPGHVTRQVQVDAPPKGQPAAHTQLTLPEPGTLAGTVAFENGVAAADVELVLVGHDQIGPGPHVTRTDAAGAFRFENLPDGRFDLVVRAADEQTRFAASLDAVAETWMRDLHVAGEMPPQQIVLAKGLTVRGFVRDELGHPLPGHLVVARAIRETPCDPVQWSPAASAECGSDGRFTLRRLQPGPWRLCVEGLQQGCEHADHFLWRALDSPDAGPALAQDGPRPGPPRPTELVFDVDLSATTPDVELVVKKPELKFPGEIWPAIEVRQPSGVYSTDVQMELTRAGATIARSKYDRFTVQSLRTDANSAAGLLRISAKGLRPELREVHDAQLEHDFGVVSLVPAPALEVSVVDAATGKAPPQTTVIAHWLGGGGADTAEVQADSTPAFFADRSEANWVLMVEAPGYRRHREQGDLQAPIHKGFPPAAWVRVELKRW